MAANEPDPRTISRAVLETLASRGEADFPDETCGFVFGTDGDLKVVPMENIQNRLHAEDPEQHERDARTAYCFDAKAMLAVLDEHERAGLPLWAIYHSHPDHDAYFSETDSAAASPFGEPSFPGAAHIVLSVRGGKTVDQKAFDWSPSAETFVEVPLSVE